MKPLIFTKMISKWLQEMKFNRKALNYQPTSKNLRASISRLAETSEFLAFSSNQCSNSFLIDADTLQPLLLKTLLLMIELHTILSHTKIWLLYGTMKIYMPWTQFWYWQVHWKSPASPLTRRTQTKLWEDASTDRFYTGTSSRADNSKLTSLERRDKRNKKRAKYQSYHLS